MKRIFVGLGIGLSIQLTAAMHDASAQDPPSPPDRIPQDITAAARDNTCSKFLPNVGLVMTVPCSLQSAENLPAVAQLSPSATAPTARSPSPRLASTQAKARHKTSRHACSEILLRLQLDDASDEDHARLRNRC